jgi:hypothetical protein
VRVTTDGRWSTAAGGEADRPLGDGGPATAARLRRATTVAALPDGGFLVADDFDYRVRRVFPDGVIRTVAGTGRYEGPLGDGGPALDARLRFPAMMAVQPDGGFLIVDEFRVRRVTPDGTITTLAGTGRSGFSGDGGPATRARIEPDALALQSDGGVLIAGQQRVRRVDRDGTITTVAGNGRRRASGDGGPAVRAGLVHVTGLHALPDGSFLVADSGAARIRRVDAAGSPSSTSGRRDTSSARGWPRSPWAATVSSTNARIAAHAAANACIAHIRAISAEPRF